MPIYEYRCDRGHTFEVMRRMTDEPLAVCQTCSAPVEQVFHPITVHFKGKGFYNTDYGTKKRARELQEAKGGDGAKPEAKPAETTASDSASAESKPAQSSSTPTKADGAKGEKTAPAPVPKQASE